MIARFQSGDAFADLDHDARALMAEDRGEDAFRIRAREREFVGVADTSGFDLDKNLTRFRAFEVYIHHDQRFARLNGDGGTGSHSKLLIV